MSEKPFCFIFTGSCGAGKSTMMRRSVDDVWSGAVPGLLPKITTRPPRENDGNEVRSVTMEEFQDMHSKGLLRASYEAAGIHYGFPAVPPSTEDASIFFQCSTPEGIEQLRLSGAYNVFSCLLKVNAETVTKRLAMRSNDGIDPWQLRERIAKGQRTNNYIADLTVDANQTIDTVYGDVRKWIMRLLSVHK